MRKENEINELVNLELKKTEYEQELKKSLEIIKNISNTFKIRRVDGKPEVLEVMEILEESDHPLKSCHLDQITNELNNQDKEEDILDLDPSCSYSSYGNTNMDLPDPPQLERISITDLVQNKFQKKKKYITAYKKYTRSDILAALEEVRKGRSALQVSKQFNIPSRTLYDKAKKMGIRTIRNRRNDKITEKQPFSGLTNIQKHVFLQGMLSENGIEDLVELDWIRFMM